MLYSWGDFWTLPKVECWLPGEPAVWLEAETFSLPPDLQGGEKQLEAESVANADHLIDHAYVIMFL